jgi:hypothetical protein
LRNEFRQSSSISVGIVDPRILATNDAGTVTFVRHYEAVIDGKPLTVDSSATMHVRKSGTSWVIESIQFGSGR